MISSSVRPQDSIARKAQCPTPGFSPVMLRASTPVSTAAPAHSRLSYFITRNNGPPVPLIPADELPLAIKLRDVPRNLTPDQTYGLYYVGSAPHTGSVFELEKKTSARVKTPKQKSISQPLKVLNNTDVHSRSRTPTAQLIDPESVNPQAFANNATTNGPASNQTNLTRRPVSTSEPAKSLRRSDAVRPSAPATAGAANVSAANPRFAAQAVMDAMLQSTSGAKPASRIGYRGSKSSSPAQPPPPQSGIVPAQTKKEFCTHWILQGWCAYEQQGCRYKHQMLDRQGLASIGIKHVPRWWMERNADVRMGLGLRGSAAAAAVAAAGCGDGEEDRRIVGRLQKPDEWLMGMSDDAGSERSSSPTDEGASSVESDLIF